MFRAPDAWDVAPAEEAQPLFCGFPEGSPDRRGYSIGNVLGKGGFGNVFSVKRESTGAEFACKTIEKRLDVPNLPAVKQEQHLNNIKREVAILTRLRAALNVVHLEEVFEDEKNVYVVMQQCKGGELLAGVGRRHYSERTVASYMRAVLRTLSQCHHHRILHRDIKPGNFMLLHNAEDSPVIAIDFGLAVFYDPKNLPVRDLGLEGTPHYMAPELLSSEVYPASDVWAAGVMAYQLLSGRFPFEDWKNPRSPALSQLWKSILTEEPKLHGSSWEEVSDGAKDFVRKLLIKDPHQRLNAQQALEHPWIQGKKKQRTEGKPLAGTIVQRLQRFGTESAFKRTVLDMIANDLLQRHFASVQRAKEAQQDKQQQQQPLQPSASQQLLAYAASASPSGPSSREGSLKRRTSALGALNSQNNLRVLAAAFRERSARNGNQSGLNPYGDRSDKSHTVHSSSEAQAILKHPKLSHLQQAVPDFRHTSVGHNLNTLGSGTEVDEADAAGSTGGFKVGSVDSAAMHGRNKWHRLLDEMHEQRMKQQKIQRLMLDTSGRGQSNFYKLHPDRAPGGDAPTSLEAVKEGVPIGGAVGHTEADRASKEDKAAAVQEPAARSLERRSIFAEFEAQHAQGDGQQPSQAEPKRGPPPEEEGRRGRGAFAALFGKAASTLSGGSSKHGPPSSSPFQSRKQATETPPNDPMPSIRTVKGAHQSALASNAPPQPPPECQLDDALHPPTQSAPQRRDSGQYPLLATGLGRAQLEDSSRQAEQPPPLLATGAFEKAASKDGVSGAQGRGGAPAQPPTGAATPLGTGAATSLGQQGVAQAPTSASQAAAPAVPPSSQHDISAQLARLRGGAEGSGGAHAGQQAQDEREGTVSKGALYNVLGKLMGGPTQLAELQAVLERLHYKDDRDKVSFSQVSEGLHKLGYKLQPHEVEALLREVSIGGDNVSQSAFLASQVDWREFQRNHREEWLECLRNAFQGLDKNKDGRICGEEILAILKEKLPEEEVNLAVQETMMDAAVMSEEGMSFDDFQALFHSDSVADLGVYESGLSNGSVHGGNVLGSEEVPPQGSGAPQEVLGGHYHPKLETVMDTGA
mmetsp:Transcript_11822/g.32269  ORF Transcript_11822/g.32269 Transcript_11822/m.32269 type:complete len:1088 (+) Transcript_11822:41-3304(+)|eukprot:CAMPEP_0202375924 /NCGR_PEP_ID=MMETSP1127-20130417/6523_1 /ASSEMBLY_ACC=CAM_ASM_000462 /TAXON_ID=3047 /ORGANISM="Dunaliella tertiolecta, Strain CCMP1320" /LENGTH=1087 /DNA_ID=CAMNT_0048973561 /DNA_START=131 /DNA_END=3394 /DNA_ORIENTATION=+